MADFEGKSIVLKNKINQHLNKLTRQNDIDFYSSMTQEEIVELKTVLADINNLLTFKTTLASVNWLFKIFGFNEEIKEKTLEEINKTSSNANGFDIHILDESYKIIAEVKCISPVNNGEKFGAAQRNSILADFQSLKQGKSKEKINAIDKYYKFLFLLDLGYNTEQAIKNLLLGSEKVTTNPLNEVKKEILLLNDCEKKEDLQPNKLYLKKIKLDDNLQ